ncbi:MAG: hypothetical protein AB1644_13685 [Candidatus Zixiibacteriota bacterium]
MGYSPSPVYWNWLGLDLKRAYQTNFVRSMVVVYGVSIIAIITISWLALPTRKNIGDTPSAPELPIGGSTGNAAGAISPIGRQVADAARTQTEFLAGGFASKIKIVHDFGVPIRPQWHPVSRIDEMATVPGESAENGPEIITTSGTSNNEIADYDIPDFPIDVTPVSPIPYYSPNNQRRSGAMLPAVAKIPPPRWPTIKRKTDTGFVRALVTIDPKGRISWAVTEVYPANSVYPDLLIEALKRGRYTPETINGQPVTTVLEISCTFCYECEASLSVVSGNIQASLLR